MVSGGYATRLNPEDPSQMLSKMNGNGALMDIFKSVYIYNTVFWELSWIAW